ncbi:MULTISPECIES: aminodeoxychorismate synthase component I [unclassified Agarivorans]|uniref:aminodeoxychorismate synthase component I n=1 Tax=unclassified Agarivorans TaxID=2636026 RepID=UPI0026E4968C|nr:MULTISPECIES: aminodeoxychorismate synthase component I [unclassified Agarivorans]MDO6686073.1 aminodeoxychorismate synthase component I [Agarivorans sp. 3_MG-2023]MDO6713789.1 aminodeoxychorismate synthase component I [Agarivorans sp. 2_MG-2023]
MIVSKTFPIQPKIVFEQLAQQQWCCFLQSAADSHENNHFDILVADPIATIAYQAGVSQVSLGEQHYQSTKAPFELLEELREQLFSNAQTNDTDFPFVGGAMGLWSYDLGRSLETLPEQITQDLNTPDMAVGFYDWALIFDHEKQQTTLIQWHDLGDQIQAEARLKERALWLSIQTCQETPAFNLSSSWRCNTSQAEYQAKFAQVQRYLLSGDCYQINLTQRFEASYQGSELDAYQRLIAANQAPFSAFMRLPQSCVLSVSPERFISLKQGQIETKPIKGTRPRSSDLILDKQLADELKAAEKDQAENLMIVDLLRNDIGRVAKPGSVSVPKLFDIESFPAVHHLVSTIRAELAEQYSAEQLLAACFPGGSITGAPKIRAMQIIEELEANRRNAYCGAIGYISANGDMDTNITIRTLVCENQKIYCWAGGGVVVDSNVDSEYQEIFDKLSRILPVLE